MASDTDSFNDLVTRCIESFRITLNDTVALNAQGVVGKMRVLIIDSERYQRETKMIAAQSIISDIKEVNDLIGGLDAVPDEPETESGAEPEAITLDEDVPGAGIEGQSYDIRNPKVAAKSKKAQEREAAKKAKEAEKAEAEAAKASARAMRFDKGRMDARLKLIQHRQELFRSLAGEEDKEGSALNVFFIGVTREEFEALDTVEISAGIGVSDLGDAETSGPAPTAEMAKALGKALSGEVAEKRKRRLPASEMPAYHIEGKGDSETIVEDL